MSKSRLRQPLCLDEMAQNPPPICTYERAILQNIRPKGIERAAYAPPHTHEDATYLNLLCRDGRVAVDQLREDAAERFDTKGQRGHIEQQNVLHATPKHSSLERWVRPRWRQKQEEMTTSPSPTQSKQHGDRQRKTSGCEFGDELGIELERNILLASTL